MTAHKLNRSTLLVLVAAAAVIIVGAVGVLSCSGSSTSNGADPTSACVHICQCAVGNDPICNTSCQSAVNCVSSSGSYGSCSSSTSLSMSTSFSFSFWSYFSSASWESGSSIPASQRDSMEQQCFDCIVSSSCDAINNGDACPSVCH